MDHIELTERFFREKVVTPVVLGMFANDEWDSIVIKSDLDDARILIARVVVCGEDVEVIIDYPGSTEGVFEMQQRLVDEFKSFIKRSDFGTRRGAEWEPDWYNAERTPAVVTRTPRPQFAGPPDCTQRLRRIARRTMRVDRRRCVSAHRRD